MRLVVGVVGAALPAVLAVGPVVTAGAAAATTTVPPTTVPTQPPTATPTVTPTATAVAPVIGGGRLGSRGVVTDLPDGVPAPPALPAAAYVLADATSGAVLVARDAHGRFLPASTLKTLTVLTVLPRLDPATVVEAQPDDLVDGTQVGLDPGSHYTVQQLLQGTMLASGNDTATALARAAGGVPQTVEAMQDLARHLGAYDTTVRNPSGLDAPGQLSSPYDLALVARAAMQLPDFRALVATKRVRFPGKEVRGHRRASYEIQNHNTLIWNYPGATGVKNGYTVAARWTTVGAATRDGRTYLLAALRRSDRSWRPEAALLDWAFAHGREARPVGRLVEPGEVDATPAVSAPPVAVTGAAAVPASRRDVGGLGPSARTVVGTAGLAAALLAVALFALSARARRQQLRAARAARLARRPLR